MVKRFQIETNKLNQRFPFLSEHKNTKLYFASADPEPILEYGYRTKEGKEVATVELADFIEVKGWKALGNKLIDKKLSSFKDVTPNPDEGGNANEEEVITAKKDKLSPGDSIDFDVEDNGQTKLF